MWWLLHLRPIFFFSKVEEAIEEIDRKANEAGSDLNSAGEHTALFKRPNHCTVQWFVDHQLHY